MKVGWMPSFLITSGFPQRFFELPMNPTLFALHHLNSQRLVRLGRRQEKTDSGLVQSLTVFGIINSKISLL